MSDFEEFEKQLSENRQGEESDVNGTRLGSARMLAAPPQRVTVNKVPRIFYE